MNYYLVSDMKNKLNNYDDDDEDESGYISDPSKRDD